MTQSKQNQTVSEICSIRIMFPVESDEQALAFKKKIGDLLADIPDAMIQFSINSAPLDRPMGRPNVS